MNKRRALLLKIADLEQKILREPDYELATNLALLNITNALVLIDLDLHEINERSRTTLEGRDTEEPVVIIANFLDSAEAAVKARDEPEARRCLKAAVEHREAITEGDAALNNKLKLLDERIKFVWRWVNVH